MVVRAPDLKSLALQPAAGDPYLLNIDASRLCYAGSPAAGGGHDDVFKDDVVNLIWAVTRV
jgi:hypothetical protein